MSSSDNLPNSYVLTQSHILDNAPPDDEARAQPNPEALIQLPIVRSPRDLGQQTEDLDPEDSIEHSRPRKLPKSDSGDSNDPSSRLFNRRLPERWTRHRAKYVCPTSASTLQAIRNFLFLASESSCSFDSSNIWVYESTISGLGRALIVTTTADMGDLIIPLSYEQAIASKESVYWQGAIQKELNGLIELGTFEYVRLVDVPPGSNLMRCHTYGIHDQKARGWAY